jgi:hypothetical protein
VKLKIRTRRQRKHKGDAMPLEDARSFVEQMRDNLEFRDKVWQTNELDDLTSFLRGKGLAFDQRELVGAMAECMAQMDQMMNE